MHGLGVMYMVMTYTWSLFLEEGSAVIEHYFADITFLCGVFLFKKHFVFLSVNLSASVDTAMIPLD